MPLETACSEVCGLRECRSQEEPLNMGAYTHVAPRIKTCMLEEGRTPVHQMPYAGRPPCASTATGFGKVQRPLPATSSLVLHLPCS